MLTIKTYLAPSQIHGIGLFSAEYIPAGKVVWKFNDFIDKILPEDEFVRTCRQVNPSTLQHLLSSSYKRNGKYFYITDNARFINHSEVLHNITFIDDFTELTLRPIYPDQELLENYFLAYDTDDFFCQEILDPEPSHYLTQLEIGVSCRASY